MKVLLLTLSVIGCAIAEAPYPASGTKPEGALLLLPPEFRQPSNLGASSQLKTETDDLATVSDKVMERLKQEQGSGSGSYHVYLADGRLQKVQFTTAPLKSGQQNTASPQQSSGYQGFSGSQQVEQFSAQLNKQQSGEFSGKQHQNDGAYSQQYSQHQYNQKQQNYPVYIPQQSEEFSSQQYFQKQQNTPAFSQQYNQKQTEESSNTQYNQQQYFQKQETAPAYSQQFNQKLSEESSYQEAAKFSSQYKQNNGQDSELNPIIAQFGKLQQELQQKQIQQLQQKQQELEQQQQELKQQQEELRSASYVASLRYSNVDPITTPIYSYKPSPVTRILRYAPQYY